MEEKKSGNIQRYFFRLATGTGVLAAGTEITMTGARLATSGTNRASVILGDSLTGWGVSLVIYSLFILTNLLRAPGLKRESDPER